MRRVFASVLILSAVLIVTGGALLTPAQAQPYPPFVDYDWCYTFTYTGGPRTPDTLQVLEGEQTENGIEAVFLGDRYFLRAIFTLDFTITVTAIQATFINLTDPLTEIPYGAEIYIFGREGTVNGTMAAESLTAHNWVPFGEYLYGTNRASVTMEAEEPFSLAALKVGERRGVNPFDENENDCAEPAETSTPTATVTPPTNTPTPSWTPGGPTPTPSYEYCTIVVLDGSWSAVVTFGGIPWDGRPESPWPGIRWWHKNVNSAQAGNSIWPFLPWEEGTPYKIQGFEVFVGRDSYQPSATQGMRLRFMDGAAEIAGYSAPVHSTDHITGLGTNNGYNVLEGGSLAGAADLELVGTNLDTFQFVSAYYGIGGSWGGANKYGFFSDLSLEVCGPPVGGPTATPTNTFTPTPTRTPISGTFVFTGTPPTSTPVTPSILSPTPWPTNTAPPVPASPTPGPTTTPLPTSTFIPTSSPLPVPTFESTASPLPTWAIGSGSPMPQITPIGDGPLPGVTLGATNLGTIPTVSHRSEVYWFLATADAQVAQLPSSIGDFIPDISESPELFGYTKWLISGVSIQEIFGPTFAPHGFHAAVGVTIAIIGALIMLGLRIVKLMLKIALWLINQVLKLIPGLG